MAFDKKLKVLRLLYFIFSGMEGDNDGNGWKFGLSFICFGIVCVMGMGVFSLVYHAQYKGELLYLVISNSILLIVITVIQFEGYLRKRGERGTPSNYLTVLVFSYFQKNVKKGITSVK